MKERNHGDTIMQRIRSRKYLKKEADAVGMWVIGAMHDSNINEDDLFLQDMVLLAMLVDEHKDIAWKSCRLEDGELCHGGDWFIVGIDTPEGSYTYRYKKWYFDLFRCEELPRAKPLEVQTKIKEIKLILLLDERR